MTRRLIPPSQCDRLRRLCEVHSMKAAAAIVGVSPSAVAKLRKRGWVAAERRRPLRSRPSDFVIQCDVMTKKQLSVHYRAGDECIRRWAAEVGRRNHAPRRVDMTIPMPDGSPEALERYGERGTPAALAAEVRRAGPYNAAASYGVSYGTMKKWRRAFGLPISWSRRKAPRRQNVQVSQIGWVDRRYAPPERRASDASL